jgi:hypothetical protein
MAKRGRTLSKSLQNTTPNEKLRFETMLILKNEHGVSYSGAGKLP